MRLTTDDCNRAPSEDFFDKCANIGKVVVQTRATVWANNSVKLFPSLGHDVWESAAGQDESDQSRARGVTPGPKEVSVQRGNLLVGQSILWCFIKDLLRIAAFAIVLAYRFLGKSIVERSTATFA